MLNHSQTQIKKNPTTIYNELLMSSRVVCVLRPTYIPRGETFNRQTTQQALAIGSAKWQAEGERKGGM